MTQWVIYNENKEQDSTFDNEALARVRLEEIRSVTQELVACGYLGDDRSYPHEHAVLCRVEPVPREALRPEANVPPGFVTLETKVAVVYSHIIGYAGDGSEAGVKAEESGVTFWGEVEIREGPFAFEGSNPASVLPRTRKLFTGDATVDDLITDVAHVLEAVEAGEKYAVTGEDIEDAIKALGELAVTADDIVRLQARIEKAEARAGVRV